MPKKMTASDWRKVLAKYHAGSGARAAKKASKKRGQYARRRNAKGR